MSAGEVCGDCIYFNQSKANKRIGVCAAPLPYYAKLADVYHYVAVDDIIASMCDCFEEDQDEAA